MPAGQHLIFESYRLESHNERLWQGNRVIPLTAKAFAVLCYLVEHTGQLVTKGELFTTLWPGTAVSDGALTFCIAELRKALGDDAKAPRFIETVHRRGYRFLPTVTPSPVISSQSSVVSSDQKRTPQVLTTGNWPPTTHLVGRGPELTQLHSWLEEALNGERQLVFVTGEAGIGKTSLVETFLKGVRLWASGSGSSPLQFLDPKSQFPNPGIWVAVGQCIEHYGPGEPYMPILEALGRLCREPGGDQLRTLLQQHAPTWLVQMPTLLTATELEALQRKTQGVTRERMLREMGEALDAITAARPLVLWLEDLHWSDASTLELLAMLARRHEPARLLVIGTYRPVDVIVQEHPLQAVKQELQLHGLCAELPLGLLSETQVAEYLTQRLHGEVTGHLPLQPLAKAIHRRTDGNPLFMVTTVEDLVSQGVLVFGGGQETRPGELPVVAARVPDTLQQLIERHIERLGVEDRRLLEVASVVGMEFSAAAVAAGLATAAEAVEGQCEELAQHGHFLWTSGTAEWPDGTVAARYSFLHALYQEVLYARIPAGRRQRLHQRIGERQEQAYGARAREIATELAVHFEQGRDYHKAVQYLQQAGENAVRRSANVEAIIHLTTALDLLNMLPDPRERAQQELLLHVALGVPLQATRGFASPEVKAVYTRARELCQQVGETRQIFPVLFGLRTFHAVRGEFLTAREFGQQLLGLAQREQDSALLVEAYWALGNTLFHLGEFSAAQVHLEQGRTFYDAQRHHSPVFLYSMEPGVFGLSVASRVLWHLGYPDQALQKSAAAQTLAQELAHPFSLTAALAYVAMSHQLRRERPSTQEWAEVALTFAREHGFPQWLAPGMILRGWALAEQGQVEEGTSQIRQGLATQQAVGVRIFHSYYLVLLAEVYRNAGQVEEGLSALAEALTMIDKTGERFYEAELYRLKGGLTLQKEFKVQGSKFKVENSPRPKVPGLRSQNTDPRPLPPDPQGKAEACFLKAIDIAQKQQAKSLELRAVMSLVRLRQRQATQAVLRNTQHEARNRLNEAHSMLAELYGWFTEGFDTKDLQEAKALIEELGQ